MLVWIVPNDGVAGTELAGYPYLMPKGIFLIITWKNVA